MKRIITMKTVKKVCFGIAAAALLFAALGCEQPFKAGLGPVVDSQNPSVNLESPGAGSYLSGTKLFTGEAKDDYKLASVWLKVTNFEDVESNPFAEYQKVSLSLSQGGAKGVWTCPIDTKMFSDGDFLIRLMVMDSMGKKGETDEIAFFIKNNPPRIRMALPAIDDISQDPDEVGVTGGTHLNYGVIDTLPESMGDFKRILDISGRMVGTISDDKGINMEHGVDPETGNELFPPQYRFWRVNNKLDPADQDGYLPGYLPTLEEEDWKDFTDASLDQNAVATLERMGLNDYLFSYTLPDTPSCFYGFEIRAQSSDVFNTDFRYPRDCWSGVEWGDYGTSPDPFITENRYVLVFARSPKEYPVIELYKLEDIYGENGWNVAEDKYNDIPGLDPDSDYPYVDKVITSKRGPFTLRIKAQHSDGIKSAEVYWEKEDKSERGRFIWDLADTDPYPGWASGSNVSAERPYSEWGRRDLNARKDAPLSTRSFVYTYNGTLDTVPSGAGYDPQARGRSKLQKYIGPLTDWDVKSKLENQWPIKPASFDSSLWQEISVLSEGSYNIEVWAVSSTGTEIPVPFTCTISIDEAAPEVDVNYIDGGAADNASADPENPVYIVNGVIRPKFRFSDSRPEDTGFRAGTSDYYKIDTPAGQPEKYGYEQLYILVKESDKGAMDTNISSRPRWWPQLPDSSSDPLVINDVLPVTALAHGPVFNSECKIKTSPVYATAKQLEALGGKGYAAASAAELPEEDRDALEDGNYWLYVLVRDNAFNVGIKRIPLRVDYKSDFPTFDFSVGTINDSVKDPNTGADGIVIIDGEEVEDGFLSADGALRNKFGANSAVRVRLRDDDGLNLGVAGGAASGVKISFIGAVDTAGNITAYDDTDPGYNMVLTDAQVKAIFAPVTQAGTPVKDRQGSISQPVLLGLLKGKDNYLPMFGESGDTDSELRDKRTAATRLPDGLYRITIAIADNSPDKLVLHDADAPAAAAEQTTVFWIAVDTIAPKITNGRAEVAGVPVTGIYVPAEDDFTLVATVSDKNGPVTVIPNSFRVTDLDNVIYDDVISNSVTGIGIERDDAIIDHWEGVLTIPVNMNGHSGEFTYELRIKDRFNNESVLTLKYSVDQEPPEVSLPGSIAVFDRVVDDVDLNGYVQISDPDLNKERLANKVIKFTIGASDNFKVEGLRWWLLPANKSAIGPDFAQPAGPGNYGDLVDSANGQVLDFYAFPALDPDGNDALSIGAYGEIDLDNRPYEVFIDTEKLIPCDGEYRLHLIAIDSAGNVSRASEDAQKHPTSNIYQEIFILQEEDKPYFGELSPGNTYDEHGDLLVPAVVGDSGLRVLGTIFEDDGFDNNVNPRTILPDSVKIWFSNNPAASDDPYDTALYTGPVNVPVSQLSRQGRNINLSINLRDTAYSSFTISGEGLKHYIIEATDSYLNKLRMPDDPLPGEDPFFDEGIRESRRFHYSFIYDIDPPEISLDYPQQGLTFGDTASTSFWVEGYMKDANLAKTENGNYFFYYRLDDWLRDEVWELSEDNIGTGGYIWIPGDTDPCPGDDPDAVYFKVDAGKVASDMLGFGGVVDGEVTGLSEGTHTVVLVAEDLSGKTTPFMLSFIKDVRPPAFSFTNINNTDKFVIEDEIDGIGYWWDNATGKTEQEWYAAKHGWLSDQAYDKDAPRVVSVIYHETGSDAILNGTFEDDVSDIDLSSFRYWIDGDDDIAAAARPAGVIDGSGRSVRWSIALTGLADGIHTIRLQVADVSGNIFVKSEMYAFRIDSAQPRVSIVNPADNIFGSADGFSGTVVFNISGDATDANLKDIGIRIVETESRAQVYPELPAPTDPASFIWLVSAYGSEPGDDPNITANDWAFLTPDPDHEDALIAEKLGWSYRITKTEYALLEDGKSYDVIAVSLDWNETLSDEDVWTFLIDKSKPVFEFAGGLISKPNDDFVPNELIAGDNANVISSQNLRIQGSVTDASPIIALQSRIENWDYTAGEWKQEQDWTDLVTDIEDNQSTEVNWNKDLSVSGLNLAQGLYRIRVQARDASYIEAAAGADGNGLFTGRGNPAVSEYVYFFYDLGGPSGLDPLFVDPQDPGNPKPLERFYSSRMRSENGILSFTVTVEDLNRIANVTLVANNAAGLEASSARVYPVGTPAPNVQPDETQTFVLNLPMAWQGAGAVPDGVYSLEFTATDMAGRSSTVKRSITLDNTSPETATALSRLPLNSVYEPSLHSPSIAKFPDASNVVVGGSTKWIRGTTGDTSANRSESGIAEVWYHLGFIDGAAASYNPGADNAVGTAGDVLLGILPKAGELADKAIGAYDRGVAYDSAVYNDRFNALAADPDSAWFKLGSATQPKFFYVDSSNIYNWSMEIRNELFDNEFNLDSSSLPINEWSGGPKRYTLPIRIKTGGEPYNLTDTTANEARKLAVPVPENAAGSAGLFVMPFWVRVTDNAGNVSYFHSDIWIYPDGDIPATTVMNPQAAGADGPRGGSVSADGVATNETSVWSVIYRVKADSYTLSTPENPGPEPSDTNIVYFDGMSMINNTDYRVDEYNRLVTLNLDGSITFNYSPNGWYMANLEASPGDPLVPWNASFNTNDEIAGLIAEWGFESTTGTHYTDPEDQAKHDMIRVYMEVFVFNGATGPNRISIAGGTAEAPKPYVREFYLKKSSPKITPVEVGYDDRGWEPYTGAGSISPQRDKFTIKATLDAASGSTLGQVSVRRPNESGNTGYVTAWNGDYVLNAGSLRNVPGLTVTEQTGSNGQLYDLVYEFDSKAASAATISSPGTINGGGWANTGGVYQIEIRIRDNLSPPGEFSYIFEISIDNFAPLADPLHVTNKNVAGTNADFMGRVYDYYGAPNTSTPPVRKIEKVYAWFTKLYKGVESYINLNEPSLSNLDPNVPPKPVAGSPVLTVLSGRYAGTSGTPPAVNPNSIIYSPNTAQTTETFPYPAAAGVWDFNGGWVKEISESAASVPGSGTLWIPNSVNADIQWQFQANTVKMPDGKMTLHYVVFDSAGNASYFEQDIIVRNKYPEIEKITLYTDNNGVGAVYTTHNTQDIASTEYIMSEYRGEGISYMKDGYLNSGFISKNSFIGFKVDSFLGNPPMNYRLQYVERGSWSDATWHKNVPMALDQAGLQQMLDDRDNPARINLYTIAGDDKNGAPLNADSRYSINAWTRLGAAGDEPGTHFVFQPVELSTELTRDGDTFVWAYNPVISRADVTKGLADDPDPEYSVLPNETNAPQEPGDGFNFSNTSPRSDFAVSAPGKIGEFDGSHPKTGHSPPEKIDPDDTAPNNSEDMAFFLIRVWDSVNTEETSINNQLYDAVVVGMNVYLTDSEAPTIRLYDLNPYTETAVEGNNIGDSEIAGLTNEDLTIRNAIDPQGIGLNIRRGGLYNTKTERELVKSGHIEPRDGTQALWPLIKSSVPGNNTWARYRSNGFIAGDGGIPNSPNPASFPAAVNNYSTGGPVASDLVSGKIILRGVAHDDQLIKEIRLQIGGTAPTSSSPLLAPGDTTTAILRLDMTSASSPTYRTLIPVNGAAAWAFERLDWKTGHTVEWAYVWNTEALPVRTPAGGPAANVNIWVAVVDLHGDSGTGLPNEDIFNISDETGDLAGPTPTYEKFHNTVTVDIVPYITGFKRQEPKYATTRSRQGWYSFYQGETGIQALGFSLLGSSATTMQVRYGASDTYPLTTTGTQSINSITFSVPEPTTANTNYGRSGKIELLVNGSDALNHLSDDSQSWNKEYHSYTSGSDLWINKPYAHIWRSQQPTGAGTTYDAPYTYMGAINDSLRLDHPGMTLEFSGNPGRLHGAWSIYGSANTFYGLNNNAARVAQYNGNPPSEPAVKPDISIFNGTGTPNTVYTYQADGNASILLKLIPSTAGSNTTNSSGITIQSGTSGTPTQRWQNIRVSKALANASTTTLTDPGRAYVSVYDSYNKRLVFLTRSGTNTYTNLIDGVGANISGTMTAPTSDQAGIGSGEFSAVGFTRASATADPLPVVAYYDNQTDTLRLAYSSATAPGNGSNNWTRKEVLTGSLRRGSGRYVSMAVDNNNFIHLAFFNSTYNTLVYAVGQKDGAFTAYTVDNVVKGGAWTDISVDNTGTATVPANPTIVYADSSRTGNYDGVRIAYKSSGTMAFKRSLNDPVTSSPITGWEALSMPSDYQVADDRLNVEVWPPANRGATLGAQPTTNTAAVGGQWNAWTAAVGYAADRFRLAYFYAPAWKDGNY